MAKMFPTVFPKNPQAQDPEYEVFKALAELPDNYSIFYSQVFKGGKKSKEECEIDFLIFDGKDCLLCLEVKGGKIEYNGKDQSWYQNNKKMDKSPITQAKAEPSSVIEFLSPDSDKINIGWALCFPDCNLPEVFFRPSGLLQELVIDETKLLHIHMHIDKAREYYINRLGRPGASSADAANIASKLTRSVSFVTKLGVRIAKDYKQIVEATEEQFEVLEDLELNPRMAIKGYAGTGKTLLATEFAKRRAHAGNVLLLFYNNPIAKFVRNGIDRNLNIDCCTFHSFAKRHIEQVDPIWWSEQEKSSDFWELGVPLKLADVITSDDCYDTIIVDEGQDFRPEWFETLEMTLRDKERGTFTVFYDDHQNIFHRWNDLPWKDRAFKKTLKKNCRNTKTIVNFLKDSNPFCKEMVSFSSAPIGVEIVRKHVNDVDEEKGYLVSDLDALLKDGVPPTSIMIIHNSERDSESYISHIEKISGHKVEAWYRGFWANKDSIYFTSIDRFKGMEADVILIADFWSKTNEASLLDLFYLQASRARTLLYIYEPRRPLK